MNKNLMTKRKILSSLLTGCLTLTGCSESIEDETEITLVLGNNSDKSESFLVSVEDDENTLLRNEVSVDGEGHREFELTMTGSKLLFSVEVKTISKIIEEYEIQGCDDEIFAVILSSRHRLSTDHSVC